ncbi:TPA: DUF2612 domain-containing protein [Escherichia coli]|nr:DUF2612 domain-containing protein [Escherichia coli]
MSKYTELITNYHATKPKFLAHVDLMTRPLIDVAAATRGLITAFDIDSAVGVQLDILGLWIGRSRVVSQPISGVYFSWDTDGLGYDQGVWQGPYDPDSGYMYLSDETYRVILKAKIAINNWDGRNDSLPAILDAATAGSGLRMQIVDTGKQLITLNNMPAWGDIPPPTREELIVVADVEKQKRIDLANDYMNGKQWPGKAAIGRLKGEELAQYNLWLDYLDALELVDTASAPDIEWPTPPAVQAR